MQQKMKAICPGNGHSSSNVLMLLVPNDGGYVWLYEVGTQPDNTVYAEAQQAFDSVEEAVMRCTVEGKFELRVMKPGWVNEASKRRRFICGYSFEELSGPASDPIS